MTRLLRRLISCWFALWLWLPAGSAQAHALQPAYLNLHERSPGQYEVFWKVPFVGEGVNEPIDEQPEIPATCQPLTSPMVYLQGGGILARWTVDCGEAGLYDQTIPIRGLEASLNDVLFRLETLSGETYSAVLRPDHPAYTVPPRGSHSQIAWSYLQLGVQHILSGYDHLLFVLGLVLIVGHRWALFKTITAFTLAHSITLGAATLGIVNIPQTPVEAVIALSILFLAVELAHRRQGRSGLTERYPWLVALTFGLLHGLGFAGALTAVGLPRSDIPLALLLFNLGVELGQIAFVAGVLAGIALLQKLRSPYPDWVSGIAPYAIGSWSAFWCFQRVAAFWTIN